MLYRPKKGVARRGVRKSVATIYDIAKHTGVSKSTVSRVVNGGGYVHPKTRSLVNKAIKSLRFSPNTAARNLVNRSEARIGLIYNNPSAAYFSELLMGALEGSSRNGAQLVVDRCPVGDMEAACNAVRGLVRTGLNGIILAAPLSEQADLIRELTKQGISIAGVATGRFRADVSCVEIDNYKAAYEMTNYLIGLGHKRIGFVKGHPGVPSSKERTLGYEAAMRDAGSKVDAPVLVQGFNDYRSGLDAGEKILTGKSKVTAIFASNDDMASAVMSMAHRKGLDVPKDLSVVGFDDTIAGAVWPELTTIRQHISKISSTAVDVIMEDISLRRAGGKPKPRNHLIEFQLVVRESTAPPR
jgi:LacI family transcriptional regulator